MRKKKVTKSLTAMLALLLVATACIGTTVAFLFDITSPVENVFDPSNIPPEIHEKLDENVKNDVYITNTGDVKAYIRAAVIFTWQDGEGNVYSTAPKEGTDYTITWSGLADNGGWLKGSEGYYYYKSAVPAGDKTKVLFTNCAPMATEKYTALKAEGYDLSVEIIASTIQAEPSSVVAKEWDVTFDDGTTTIKEVR